MIQRPAQPALRPVHDECSNHWKHGFLFTWWASDCAHQKQAFGLPNGRVGCALALNYMKSVKSSNPCRDGTFTMVNFSVPDSYLISSAMEVVCSYESHCSGFKIFRTKMKWCILTLKKWVDQLKEEKAILQWLANKRSDDCDKTIVFLCRCFNMLSQFTQVTGN